MGNVDGLKVQVEEMKQRLCASDAEHPTETGEFKDRLASIKATLQTKQDEIDRLAVENKQLQGKQDEIDRLAAENKQLHGMLKEVLSAIDEHQSKASGDMLRAFYTETAVLVEPAKDAEARNGEAAQSKAEPVSIIQQKQTARPQQDQPATPAAQDEDGDDFEGSPALRRIMKRSRKGR
jgi:predicted nuclease with TOPRIM domain